jgi:hypothetical protein
MPRSLALGLCATVALTLAMAGCKQDGSYRVSWSFMPATSTGEPENAASGCGQHGVDGILVTAVDTGADSDQVLAICTSGQVTRGVPVGTWAFQVQALDAEGAVMPSVVPTVAVLDPHPVVDGQTTDVPPVILTYPTACSDGIDNDGDGRVDLDDPGCAGDSTGLHE